MAIDSLNYEYDPVKEVKGGAEAAKVIWSTKSLLAAVDALNKGLPLKANPFIGSRTGLLKPDLVYKRTQEEMDDIVKCIQDPVYFASKCFLMTPEGLQAVTLRDYQIDYLRHLQHNRFSIFLSCRQSGKSTTTAIYCLWMILFHPDKNALILSKSGAAGIDLVSKIKDMYMYLPYYLKCGTMKWNQSSISFDNNSSISTESFSPTAGLGKTINFLILDEFAWCNPNEVELFYNNIIPTVTTISDSNVCIMSTQNGFNLFYKLWKSAIEKKSIYAPFKVDWDQVPQFNMKTKTWEKRTEAWHKEMVGILGSEEAFQYQYGTQFSASDACLVSRETLKRIRDNGVLFDTLDRTDLFDEHIKIKPGYDVMNFKDLTRHFVVMVDLAEGGGGDSTIFNVFELTVSESGKPLFDQVAYWSSNTTDIEHAALEFWLLMSVVLDQQNTIISIEWNTYGALFYNYLLNLNESDYQPETSWRFQFGQEIDSSIICQYNKGDMNEDIAGLRSFKNMKTIPGMRWTGESKKTGCALLKMMLENAEITITDIIQIGELENFEDKTGNGSYKASFGHDDMMMTLVQIPMMKQTAKFKGFIEDVIESRTLKNNKMEFGSNMFDFSGSFGSMIEVKW
jgi:hypothetical protein